jgi:L-rhamnose mutarotase
MDVNRRWAHWFRDIIAEASTPEGDPLRYGEVFHSDGRPLDGRFERGCFSLVIDPERAEFYDALHAEPWPEMVAALEDAGYRNYSGFRRGAHVVYYGEYYPDMATVLARIGVTDVSARWGKAFEGVITTITDPGGSLYTAREIHHND